MEEIMQDIKVLYKKFDELKKEKQKYNEIEEELRKLKDLRQENKKSAKESKKRKKDILENLKQQGNFSNDMLTELKKEEETQQKYLELAKQVPVEDKKRELNEKEEYLLSEINNFKMNSLEKLEQIENLYIDKQNFEQIKQEIEQLEFSKKAYIRVAENDRKTIDKFNEQLRVGNVDYIIAHRDTYDFAVKSEQENKKRASKISEEIKEKENVLSKYRIIDENLLEYLALKDEINQIQNFNFYNMQTSQIGNFIKEYEKVNSENETEQTRTEEPQIQGGQDTNQTGGTQPKGSQRREPQVSGEEKSKKRTTSKWRRTKPRIKYTTNRR